MGVTLLLQVLNPLFQDAGKGEGLTSHNAGSLKSYLTGEQAGVIVLTTQKPRLHVGRHLHLVEGIRKGSIMSPDSVGKAEVTPDMRLPSLGCRNNLGVNLRESGVIKSIEGLNGANIGGGLIE